VLAPTGPRVSAAQSGIEKLLFPLLQEDLLAAVNWGQVSPEWLEIEAAGFPEKPGPLEDLETDISTRNLKRDLQSADNEKAQT